MKSTFTTLLALLVIGSAACILTGCVEAEKLAECEQNAADLQAKLDKQENEIARFKANEQTMGISLIEAITSNEMLKKEIESLKKTSEPVKPTYTPEQKENIRKGIEQLRKLQMENAKRLQQKAAEKSAE